MHVKIAVYHSKYKIMPKRKRRNHRMVLTVKGIKEIQGQIK
jgi:hypothetical protein